MEASAGARATITTPVTRAVSPPVCSAIIPDEAGTFSRNTTMPSTMPHTGSAAVMAGSEACSGAALNAFCISHNPATLAATRL